MFELPKASTSFLTGGTILTCAVMWKMASLMTVWAVDHLAVYGVVGVVMTYIGRELQIRDC